MEHSQNDGGLFNISRYDYIDHYPDEQKSKALYVDSEQYINDKKNRDKNEESLETFIQEQIGNQILLNSKGNLYIISKTSYYKYKIDKKNRVLTDRILKKGSPDKPEYPELTGDDKVVEVKTLKDIEDDLKWILVCMSIGYPILNGMRDKILYIISEDDIILDVFNLTSKITHEQHLSDYPDEQKSRALYVDSEQYVNDKKSNKIGVSLDIFCRKQIGNQILLNSKGNLYIISDTSYIKYEINKKDRILNRLDMILGKRDKPARPKPNENDKVIYVRSLSLYNENNWMNACAELGNPILYGIRNKILYIVSEKDKKILDIFDLTYQIIYERF